MPCDILSFFFHLEDKNTIDNSIDGVIKYGILHPIIPIPIFQELILNVTIQYGFLHPIIRIQYFLSILKSILVLNCNIPKNSNLQ